MMMLPNWSLVFGQSVRVFRLVQPERQAAYHDVTAFTKYFGWTPVARDSLDLDSAA